MPSHAHARHLAKKCPAFAAQTASQKTAGQPIRAPASSNLHQSQRPELCAADFVAGHELLNIPTDKHLQQTAGRD